MGDERFACSNLGPATTGGEVLSIHFGPKPFLRLPGAKGSVMNALALTADSLPFLADVSIGRRVLVPLRAVCLFGIKRRRGAASERVFPLGHSLQVLGVDARGIAAEVVDGEASRNRANERRVREAMREPLSTMPLEMTVAFSGAATGPGPASRVCLDDNPRHKQVAGSNLHLLSLPFGFNRDRGVSALPVTFMFATRAREAFAPVHYV